MGAELYSDKVAAVVNGDVILESDVAKAKQPFMRSLSSLPLGVVPPGKWPTEREILDELIVMRILEQEASRKGLKVDDKGVDASIDAVKKRNRLTQEQFVVQLAASGLSYQDYRKMMKRQLTLSRLIEREVTAKVPMSEEDAQLYFKKHRDKIDEEYQKLVETWSPSRPPQEQVKPEIPTHEEIYVGGKVRLRQIVLKIPADGKRQDLQKVIEKAKLIFSQASTGADFAGLAKKFSDDPSAKKGGDLGFMDYKDMVPALQKMVQHLKPGDVTPPLKVQGALLIFYLDDAKGRTLKKVPIPEKTRKELEKRWKESRQASKPEKSAGEEPPKEEPKPPPRAAEERAEDKKASGILTAAEEQEYEKVRPKVIAILKTDKIQARMKEWIDELKKKSLIEVKL